MIDFFTKYKAEVRVEEQFLIPCDFSSFTSQYKFTYLLGKDLNHWLHDYAYKDFKFKCETISPAITYKYYMNYRNITVLNPQIEFYNLCNPRIL